MSTEQIWQTSTSSLEETLQLASAFGERLHGGEVIELVSDLGGGKTSFVRGLAKGMGSQDRVSSPTFTITNQYQANQLILHHFDFYRLQEPGIMKAELAEILTDPLNVVVIEWAEVVADILPEDRLTIQLTSTGDTARQLTVHYPASLAYLLPA